MPIPISQTLQLAGQQEVTPWQLPFEELAYGLSKKQENFDTKSEQIELLNTLIPDAGVFSQEARQGLLDDYNYQIESLSEELYTNGNISKGKITALAKAIAEDERLGVIKDDVTNWTPLFVELKAKGALENGVHDVYDETGRPKQALTKEQLPFFYLKNQDYLGITAEWLDKTIKPLISEEISANNLAFKKDPITGNVLLYDESTGTYSKDRTTERIYGLLTNPSISGGMAPALSKWESNTDEVAYFKALFKQNTGRDATYEDYLNEVIEPAAELIGYKETKESEEIKIVDTGGGGGGTGDTEPDADLWNTITVKEGVFEQEKEIVNVIEEKVGKDFEDLKLEDLYVITNKVKDSYDEHIFEVGEMAGKETENYIKNMPAELAPIANEMQLGIEVDDLGIAQASFLPFEDTGLDEQYRDNYNKVAAGYRNMVNESTVFNNLNKISLDYKNSYDLLYNFQNAMFERFGLDMEEVERQKANTTYEMRYDKVKKERGLFEKIGSWGAVPDFWEAFIDAKSKTSNFDSNLIYDYYADYIAEEYLQKDPEITKEYNDFVQNYVEREYIELSYNSEEWQSFKEEMLNPRTYNNDAFVFNSLLLTDNATNTSIKNLNNNIITQINTELNRLVDFSAIKLVSTDMPLTSNQNEYLADIISNVSATMQTEGKDVTLKTNINGVDQPLMWNIRKDLTRGWMLDLKIPNLPLSTDDFSNEYKMLKGGVGKESPSLNWIEIPMSEEMVNKIIYNPDYGLTTQVKANEIERFRQVSSDLSQKGYATTSLFKEDNRYNPDNSKNDINIIWSRDKENSLVGTFKIGEGQPIKVSLASEKDVALLESSLQTIVRNPVALHQNKDLIIETLRQDLNGKLSTQGVDTNIFLSDLVSNLISYTPIDMNTDQTKTYLQGMFSNSVPITEVISNPNLRLKNDADLRIDPKVAPQFNSIMGQVLFNLEGMGALKNGNYIEITDALRSLEELESLSNNPNTEASPNSSHLYGRGVDFVIRDSQGNKNVTLMKKIAEELGLYDHGQGDMYHIHLNL
jgi:hypothetical protein